MRKADQARPSPKSLGSRRELRARGSAFPPTVAPPVSPALESAAHALRPPAVRGRSYASENDRQWSFAWPLPMTVRRRRCRAAFFNRRRGGERRPGNSKWLDSTLRRPRVRSPYGLSAARNSGRSRGRMPPPVCFVDQSSLRVRRP
jgi:hypothetical protein